MIQIHVTVLTHMGRTVVRLKSDPLENCSEDEKAVAQKIFKILGYGIAGFSEKGMMLEAGDPRRGSDKPPEGFVPEGS